MEADTELLLMVAGRIQHVAMTIKPALAKGYWVLCDRFLDASYAYQGGGRGIAVERIQALEHWLSPLPQPSLTLLLTASVEQALNRARQRSQTFDRIEQEQVDFFQRVQQAYLQRAQHDPQRFQCIDTETSLAKVQAQLRRAIQTQLGALLS
jgi:dTMP kinase